MLPIPMELEFPVRIGRREGTLTCECSFPPDFFNAENTLDVEIFFDAVRNGLLQSDGFLIEMDNAMSNDIHANLMHYYSEISDVLNLVFSKEDLIDIYNEDEPEEDDETDMSVFVYGVKIKLKMFSGHCEFSFFPIDPFAMDEEVSDDGCCDS